MTKSTHGIDGAYFSNLPGSEKTTCLDCFCGWGATGLTWAEVGQAFDEHLAEAQ